MIRALFFLIAVAAFAYLAAYLGGLDGRLTATVQGYVVDAHTGLIIGLGLFVLAVIFASAIGLKTLVDWPGKVKRKAFEARRAKGMLSLTRGLEAVAAGDATDATRLANAANRQLEEPALTRLLTAQAAQLSGDEGTAREAFTAMLAAPETEFLGRRGLYLQAMKAGDAEAAATHAERAFRLRPNAEWAFRSVFDLALERAAWGEARAALDLAQKNGVVGGEDAARSKAALLTADAYAANAAGDGQTALKEAEEAAKLAADFTPAAVLAARRLAASGKTGRAEKTLEAAWAAKPHRAIALAYGELRPKETPATKAERLTKLADLLPFHEESVLLRAEQNVALENWSAAREGLETLLTQKPTARAYSLMAAAVAGESGSQEAARPWYDRAVTAPRETGVGLDGAFDLSARAWSRLVQEYAQHGRLEPPSLADAPRGLTPDEIRMLIPARPEPADTDDAAEEQAEAPEAASGPEPSPSPESPSDEAAASADDGEPTAPGGEEEPTPVEAQEDAPAPAGEDEPAAAPISTEEAEDEKPQQSDETPATETDDRKSSAAGS